MRRKINVSFLSLQPVFDVLVKRERVDVLLCFKIAAYLLFFIVKLNKGERDS